MTTPKVHNPLPHTFGPMPEMLGAFVVSLQPNMSSMSPSPLLFIPLPVYVSKPRISFSISKEGDSYHGNVTCWSARGSPPVNFSLSLDDKEAGSVTATGSLAAWFPVAILPGLDMGVARCRVTTEVQELMSEPVTLVVGMSYTDMLWRCVFLSLSIFSSTL